VVCTKSAFIGYVGWVGEINKYCPGGTINYYFPRYKGEKHPYTANVAMRHWGLCAVPDDTDMSLIMSAEKARSYLRVREIS